MQKGHLPEHNSSCVSLFTMTERIRNKIRADGEVFADTSEDFQSGCSFIVTGGAFIFNNWSFVHVLVSPDEGQPKTSGFCGLLLTALSFLLILATFPVSVWSCMKVRTLKAFGENLCAKIIPGERVYTTQSRFDEPNLLHLQPKLLMREQLPFFMISA